VNCDLPTPTLEYPAVQNQDSFTRLLISQGLRPFANLGRNSLSSPSSGRGLTKLYTNYPV